MIKYKSEKAVSFHMRNQKLLANELTQTRFKLYDFATTK